MNLSGLLNVVLIGQLLFFFTQPTSAWASIPAQPVPDKISALKSRSSGLISEAANRRLQRAQELASSEDYAGAIQTLKEYLSKGIGETERSQFLQNLGFIQAQKGEYKTAQKTLKEALAMGVLPYGPTVSTMFALAQLSLAAEDYKGTLQQMTEFFSLVEDPKAEAFVVTATAQAQLGQKDKALALVELAIEKTPKPAENWLLFALGLNFEKENWPRAVVLLEILTANYPQKGQYWKQLAGVYLNLGKTTKALATMELAHKKGYLEKEADLLNLAALRLDQGQPLQAAVLVETQIKAGKIQANRKNWEVVADAYLIARETDKALKAMQEAASKEGDGKVLAKQGQIYIEREDWKKAAESLKLALQKGGVSAPEQVLLGLGIAEYHLKDFTKAKERFLKAQEHKEDFRAARQWLNFVEDELMAANVKL